MVDDIDLHMGRRLRRRRLILGLTQQQLGSAAGVQFQQIQKFECAANKMSAGRVWSFAKALDVPISYFYDGLNSAKADCWEPCETPKRTDVLSAPETVELVDAYYGLKERPRRHFLDLAKSLNMEDAA